MKASQIIEDIIQDDIDTIKHTFEENDLWYLDQILRNGHTGYVKYSLKELKQEYEERFGVPAEEDEPVVNDLNLK